MHEFSKSALEVFNRIVNVTKGDKKNMICLFCSKARYRNFIIDESLWNLLHLYHMLFISETWILVILAILA